MVGCLGKLLGKTESKLMTARDVMFLLQIDRRALMNLSRSGVLNRVGKSRYARDSVMAEFNRRVLNGIVDPD